MKAVVFTSVLTVSAALALTVLQTRKVAANTGAAASSGCIACHQGARSFEGRDVDELAQRIHAVLQGEVRHPPLGLGDTSNEAIEQLAAELAGDQSAGS